MMWSLVFSFSEDLVVIKVAGILKAGVDQRASVLFGLSYFGNVFVSTFEEFLC